MNTLPADLKSLLATAIRDVIWYKESVIDFFKSSGMPPVLLKELDAERRTTPTIKLVKKALAELEKFGDQGWVVSKRMLTSMVFWKGEDAIEIDRREKAKKALADLRKAMKDFDIQQEFEQRKAREQREKEQQAEREARGGVRPIDHAKLQAFRDEFDVVYFLSDPHERGNRFEKLMNDIFSYYNERSEGPFSRTGEQVDGMIYFDKHWYLVEIRWKADKANAADVSVLRDRANRSFGGDTKGLFISFNGFSQECYDSMLGGDYERVILFDGGDLRCVLDGQIAFDLLLAEKQLELVKNKRPWVSAFEIIARRK